MVDKFLGFVRRGDATVAKFEGSYFDEPTYVLDCTSCLIRQYNDRRYGLDNSEIDSVVREFHRCMDAQDWEEANRRFLAWVVETEKKEGLQDG